jgi:GAF domain-containing protein
MVRGWNPASDAPVDFVLSGAGSSGPNWLEGAVVHKADHRHDYQRVQALQATGLLTSPAPPEFPEICRRACERFEVSMALVTLIDTDQQIVKAGVGTDLQETPRSAAFCDYTIRADEVLVVQDTKEDPRFASNPLVTGVPFIRFYAGAPLTYLRDVRLGAFCLLDNEPRDFSLQEQAELATLADEVVVAIIQHQFDRALGKAEG